MKKIEAINAELQRLYEYQIAEGGWTYDEFANLLKPLHEALARTTEDASHNSLVGEQDDDGKVGAPTT